MTARLKYLSNETVEKLRKDVPANIERYRSGDFTDLMADGDWGIELKLEVDLSPLEKLDPARASEAENSRLVWQALSGLTPSVAYEEGVWTRLTHVECLEYSRARWIAGCSTNEEVEKNVRTHFFADTLTKRRDDNPLSRLWWNAYMADQMLPGTNLMALDIFLAKADFRLNFIERSYTVSRPALAAGVVRLMENEPWVTSKELNFRRFMAKLNQLGGGMVFEALNPEAVDRFMVTCAERAGMNSDTSDEVTDAASSTVAAAV